MITYTKKCNNCNFSKTLKEFHVCKNGLHGVRGRCKLCEAKRHAAYRDKNRSRMRERDRLKYLSMTEEERHSYIMRKSRGNRLRPNILETRRKYNSTAKAKFTRYRVDASRRTKPINFTLTFEQFEKLVTSECKYCGGKGHGIDRFNSDIGYTLENSVPCCRMCNEMKLNYKFDDWINQMKKILEFNKF